MNMNDTKGIIDGFEEDFNQIVEEFAEVSPNLQLGSFFRYWNEKSMDCLFANRFDPRELLEAVSRMNQMLQPDRLRRKIRLTCDDVISIQQLSSADTKSDIANDTNFVWRQLKTLDAIDFVEERAIYGPSLLVNKRTKKRAEHDLETSDVKSDEAYGLDFVQSQLEPAINEVEGLCGPYEQIRDAFRLDDYNDTTVEIQSSGTVREFVDRAKLLLFLYKTEYS